ncbi:MAG: YIP1 family protein [bacterium]|nr:YIP1 family protein [bacterium]
MAKQLKQIFGALVNPEAFFEGADSGSLKKWIGPILVLIGAVTLVLVVTRLLGPADPVFLESGEFKPPANLVQNPSPLRRFLFPLYWAGIVLYGWFARYGGVLVFGENNRRARDVLMITLIGALPLLLLSALFGTINQLFPYWQQRPDSVLFVARLAANFLFFAFAFLWEARIVVAGFRILFDQNRGRAIVTWLLPAIGLLFCATPAVMFLYVSVR